jgi:hypothetical protein
MIRTSEKYFFRKDFFGEDRRWISAGAGTGLLEGFLRYLFENPRGSA